MVIEPFVLLKPGIRGGKGYTHESLEVARGKDSDGTGSLTLSDNEVVHPVRLPIGEILLVHIFLIEVV